MTFDFESEFSTKSSPAKPNKFQFNASKSDAFLADILSKKENLHDRISTLAREITIQDQPLVMAILNSFPNATAEELNDLGEALIRISKMYPVYVKLQEQIKFVQYARDNPMLVAHAFGEFDFENLSCFSDS